MAGRRYLLTPGVGLGREVTCEETIHTALLSTKTGYKKEKLPPNSHFMVYRAICSTNRPLSPS